MSEGVEVLSKRGKAIIQEENKQGSDEEGQTKADGKESSETDDCLGQEPKPKTRSVIFSCKNKSALMKKIKWTPNLSSFFQEAEAKS